MPKITQKMKIGIIGGSGLDDPDILEGKTEKIVDTPYGKPSDALILGKIKGVDCVLLARHGRKHEVYPSTVNYRANIWALREEGCSHIVVTTACGSLQEDYAPGDIVFLDSFIDRTYRREQTFYDGKPGSPKGVLHLPMHQPFCRDVRKLLIECAKELKIAHHETGTNVTIEGPRFSSKAESKVFQSWGGSVINMTTVPEVVLANELGMCYAAIALVTDYDCWRDVDEDEHVNVSAVLKTFKENAEKAKSLLVKVIPRIAAKDWTETLAHKQNIIASANMSN